MPRTLPLPEIDKDAQLQNLESNNRAISKGNRKRTIRKYCDHKITDHAITHGRPYEVQYSSTTVLPVSCKWSQLHAFCTYMCSAISTQYLLPIVIYP
jgi:hypothetical protein